MATLLYWQVGDVRSPTGENWKHRARSASCPKQQLETLLRADAERVGIEAGRTSNSSTARWGVRWQGLAAIVLVVIAAMALLTFLRR